MAVDVDAVVVLPSIVVRVVDPLELGCPVSRARDPEVGRGRGLVCRDLADPGALAAGGRRADPAVAVDCHGLGVRLDPDVVVVVLALRVGVPTDGDGALPGGGRVAVARRAPDAADLDVQAHAVVVPVSEVDGGGPVDAGRGVVHVRHGRGEVDGVVRHASPGRLR